LLMKGKPKPKKITKKSTPTRKQRGFTKREKQRRKRPNSLIVPITRSWKKNRDGKKGGGGN